MSDPESDPTPIPGADSPLDPAPDQAAAARAIEHGAGRAASLVGAGILLSRVFGFARNFLFTRYFGMSEAADAYAAALKIPNFVRNLLGEGTISASFIPVYSAMLGRGDPADARRLAGAVLGLLLVFVSALTILGIAVAPFLVELFLAGKEPEVRELTTRLVRIMFPMTGIMVISAWCLGIQNSHGRFFLSYASAVLWSLVQIVLLLGWGPGTPDLERLAWLLAWATLGGAVAQVLVQLPQALRLTAPLRVRLDRSAPGLATTVRNFLPVVIALGVVQISAFVDVFLASWLPTGTIAALEYARIVFLLPIGVFGVSVAASSLPDLSRDSGTLAFDTLRQRLRIGWLRLVFYIVPSMVVLIVYGDHVVSLLYRSGEFGAVQTRITHLVLAAFALGLIGFASVKLLASAHYAMQDYRTPLRSGVISLVVGSLTAAVLAFTFRASYLGAAGIALGSAVASYANLATLVRGLRRRLGVLWTEEMWRGAARVAAASGAAAVGASGVEWLVRDAHFRIAAIGTLLAFGGIFLLTAHILGNGEAGRWLRAARLIR
ncbi:MAG TPA: murein biosynthesis integral membrane protein MurJ [Gemmatimonadaceae bacterium]|nr:murein biosynthesis integral membrane protein MurJ [Gemmatimonadaceae bacterium]